MTLSLNQKLAAAAFGLGLLALLGDPFPGPVARVDARELGVLVQNEADHIPCAVLADWIIEGRADYRLIDLRDAKAFETYRIPGAENIPPAGLFDAGLPRNEKLVLYSDGGIHAAQTWLLLKARGYKSVYNLLGGLDAWSDEVLHPSLPANPSEREQALYQKAVQVSAFFGGAPREGGAAAPAIRPAAVPSALPVAPVPGATVAPPPPRAPAAAPAATPPKKKRQGC